MKPTPRTSVITIFLNAQRFLAEAIESVLAQTFQDWELLLVDDGSTDRSTDIAKDYAVRYRDKITYLDHAGHRNLGMSTSRNLGIQRCRGAYVAFLDADDTWFSDKLNRQLAILESQPLAGLTYGATQYWHGWTGLPRDLARDFVCDVGIEPNQLVQPPTLLNLMLDSIHTPAPSNFMVRHDLLERVGGFEESFAGIAQAYEDQAFLAKVYLESPVFVSNDCCDRYRVHDDSYVAVVTRSGQQYQARLVFLDWLQHYLLEKGVGCEIRAAAEAVVAQRTQALGTGGYGAQPVEPASELEVRAKQWWLRVARDSRANLEFLDEAGAAVRIAIERSAAREAHDIQLNEARFPMSGHQAYAISFSARAEGCRSIEVGCSKGYPPWSNLGVYHHVDLTGEWCDFDIHFLASDAASNARIHFDVGSSSIPVELARVSLRSLSGGTIIRPDVPFLE